MKIIGICGGSCSGKSTLIENLEVKLKNLTVVHFDDFFVGKERLEGKEINNWEDPTLYRLDDYEKALEQLSKGKDAEIEANSRESRHEGISSRILKPADYVIVEGFLIFHTERARRYFDKKIYLDIPEEEIIKRRYERMNNGGGKYSDEYIKVTLIQEHRKLVIPQKQYADLIVDATKSSKEMAEEVLAFIHTN